jgi:hypothetical protein
LPASAAKMADVLPCRPDEKMDDAAEEHEGERNNVRPESKESSGRTGRHHDLWLALALSRLNTVVRVSSEREKQRN